MSYQKELDNLMLSKAKDRYYHNLYKNISRSEESVTPHGRALMAASLVPIVKLLDEKFKPYKLRKKGGVIPTAIQLLLGTNLDLLALITIKTTLDTLASQKTYTSLALSIAKRVEDELVYIDLAKHQPKLWRFLQRDLSKVSNYVRKRVLVMLTISRSNLPRLKWTKQEKVHVGSFLLESLIESTGLVKVEQLYNNRGHSRNVVVMTERTRDWVTKFHNYKEISKPFYLPMVQKPAPWTGLYGGGYVLDGCKPIPIVNTGEVEHLEMCDMSQVYDALNHLQSVRWRINKRVYDVIKTCVDTKVDLGSLPRFVPYDLPPRPEKIDTDYDVRKKWRRDAYHVKLRNIKLTSKVLSALGTMDVAKRFLDHAFYFPYQLDFRGRVYSMSTSLNPQSADFSRALLEFADGKPLRTPEAEEWFLVSGANLYGVDKVSFPQRRQWVDENRENIIKSAQSPHEFLFWTRADKPFQFLAFCFEYQDYVNVGLQHVTHMPVHLDGSNNGIQLLSILSRDAEAGKATNCLPNCDPNDLYGDIADVTKQLLTEDGSIESQFWLDYGIDRKTTKRQVMVFPYGGTRYSCEAYTQEWFDDKEEAVGRRSFVDGATELRYVRHLSETIWKAIGQVLTGPKTLMDWFQNVARVFNDEQMAIMWELPSGFMVNQMYYNPSKARVKTKFGEHVRKVSIKLKDESRIYKRRQVNAVAPNIIHSLDANLLMSIVNRCRQQGLHHMQVIHDSFACPAPDIPVLFKTIRSATVDLFGEDLLYNLYEQFQSQVETKLDKPPKFDTMDINDIENSLYFFA